MKLKHKKDTQDSNILSKFWKKDFDFLPNVFRYSLMNQLNHQNFLLRWNKLVSNITPVSKTGSRNQKQNYRPVSILPIASKTFEKILSNCLYIYFEYIISKFQSGFRNGFNTHYCLLLMIEKLKEAADIDQSFEAFLTELSTEADLGMLQHPRWNDLCRNF